MPKVRPVNKEDFDKVYPLFKHIPKPIPIKKETWRNLFNRQWNCQVEPLGYVLMEENEIVGYIGLIAVQRKIHGQWHEIMDLTSWTVNKQYGGHAIQMLSPFIQDQKRTLRCFTPAKSVNMIFRRFGFQELNAFLQIIPFWAMSFGQNDYEISFDIDRHRPLLTQEDWQIYGDHRKFSSEHFIIKKDQTYCYVVAKRVFKKKLPFLHVHYISDKQRFAQVIPKFAGTICWHSKTLGLIVFEHCLERKKIPGAIKMEMQAKPLFRSQTLKPEDIDSLYSEFFILDF